MPWAACVAVDFARCDAIVLAMKIDYAYMRKG